MINKYDNYNQNSYPAQYPTQQNYGAYNPQPQNTNFNQPKQKKGFGAGHIALTVCLCIVFSSLFGLGGAFLGSKIFSSADNNTNGPVINYTTPATSTSVNNSFDDGSVTSAANLTADSVVEITTESATNNAFFSQYVVSGAGSGVIISEDGYIVSNNHVVSGANTITVKTRGGTEYTAKVIGTDASTDIAVLKIEPTEKLSTATFGNSESISVGQRVIAIGNPLGSLGGSVTDGIISALDREITIEDQTMNLMQTTAAVNPGNSGGGLFNLNGELIGIVNAKSSGSGIEGIGFAIPVNTVKTIVEELISHGYVKGRPVIGINYIEVADFSDMWQYGVSELGVYITASKNPLLEVADRIVAIDGDTVSTGAQIKAIINQKSVGDTLEVTVARKGKMISVVITLIEYTPDEQTSEVPNP